MRVGVLGGGHLLRALDIDSEELVIETPFGQPSDPVRRGVYRNVEVFTLLRHGREHQIAAHRVNYRANVAALASLQVEVLFGISTCGSISARHAEGVLAVYDQILDLTYGRAASFHEEGPVRHVSVADPACVVRAPWACRVLEQAGVAVAEGGTMAVVQGPRFATRAESHAYAAMGATYINMSAAPEAFLAREAGLCYVPLSLVTDVDNAAAEAVTLRALTASIARNRHAAPNAMKALLDGIATTRLPACSRCTPAGSDLHIADLDL